MFAVDALGRLAGLLASMYDLGLEPCDSPSSDLLSLRRRGARVASP